MDSKLLFVVGLLVVAAHVATASFGFPPLDIENELEADFSDADEIDEIDERDLQELANEMDTEQDLAKRGIFSCAKLFSKCHAFKHCCGKLKCNRRSIIRKGICLKYV